MDESLAKKEEEEATRNSQLQLAIEHDDVDELYRLIEGDEKLLDHGSEGPFPNTPLHYAADKGKTKVAMEIAILKPLFAQKLNRGGHSPMHLALQKKHYDTARALMTFNLELIRVRGRGGITPLHYVAGKEGDNELELLRKFLYACTPSIEILTSRCETAVHVAVKNHNLKAFKDLFEWLMRANRREILDWKDLDGNTVLQIAASENLVEIIKLLLTVCKDEAVAEWFRRQGHPTRYLPEFFSRELAAFEKCAITVFEKCAKFFRVQNEATRNVILVVSTLIVDATYQATLTPPGGYWQDSSSNPKANSSSIALRKPHQAGDIIMGGWKLYLYFICNSMAFYASIATILAATLPLEATSIVYISIPFLCTAFFISLSIQIPISTAVAVISAGVLFELSLLATLWLLVYVKIVYVKIKNRGVPRIDTLTRRLPTFLGPRD